MSAATCKKTIYDDPVEAELDLWPGVSWSREVRSKHYALVLTFGGVSRFVIYPCSPSDAARGVANHLRDVRAALRAIGATRVVAEKRQPAPRRKRAPSVTPKLKAGEKIETRLSQDPFAALAQIKFAEPAPEAQPEPKRRWAWLRRIIAKFTPTKGERPKAA